MFCEACGHRNAPETAGAGGFAAGRRLDGPGQQTFDVRCTDIVTVRMVAGAAYGAGRDRRRAVARIEFFGRRS
ncbi:hypothetical protein [Streptomyces xantholiticus]|uniref:Uncharacterized protein n=1 Tax=Streptomyces xantholiticus TaxID=68285 RepID=A0ABV1V400_9ACTN